MHLFVGGVNSTIPAEEIEHVFSKYGKVENVEIGFPGFVFVVMKNEEEGLRAMRELDNTKSIGDRNINVKESTTVGYETAMRFD